MARTIGSTPAGSPALLVIAKAPLAGHVKTRLSPPLTPRQAAGLAEAALVDTLETVLACGASRVVLALEGTPGEWLPEGFEVFAQHGGDLAERLAHAFATVAAPALLIGMDTPQVGAALLDRGLDLLERNDAVLGACEDGGYWTIGLRHADRRVFAGIPMSTADTGAAQRARLDRLGLSVASMLQLRDVDDYEDAGAVAALTPHSRFARALAAIDSELAAVPA